METAQVGQAQSEATVGTRVRVVEDYALVSSRSIAKASLGVVQTDPAWDEDSRDPDRLITVALSSGESVAVPRRIDDRTFS